MLISLLITLTVFGQQTPPSSTVLVEPVLTSRLSSLFDDNDNPSSPPPGDGDSRIDVTVDNTTQRGSEGVESNTTTTTDPGQSSARDTASADSVPDLSWLGIVDPFNELEDRTERPYGSWLSPITSTMATEATNTISEPPQLDPVTGHIFWAENVVTEGSRNVVFSFDPETREITRWTRDPYDLRTLVHEYGGGTFVVYNNTLFFSNKDNFLYKQIGPEGPVRQLTNTSYRRYADGSYSPQHNALFVVVEDHELALANKTEKSQNGILMVDADTGEEIVVTTKSDFYSSPRVSADGTKLLWIQWKHPNMPWGNTRMFVGDLTKKRGRVAITKYLQHGSMMMPSWSPDNELLYVHDMTLWWNLYIINRRNFEINLTPYEKEVGWPMWMFAWQAYSVNPALGRHEVVVISGNDLMVVDTRTQENRTLDTGYTSFSKGIAYGKDGTKAYTVAGNAMTPFIMIEVDLETGTATPLRKQKLQVDEAYISVAQQIEFPTTDGDIAYGYLYLPKNKDFKGPKNDRPGLLVRAHQGPTWAAMTSLQLQYQFFTSRGWAILDVDYRGSSGYGSFYRYKLKEKWGIYDVDDVVAGARFLVESGLVNETKLCIDGQSAGGFTTLSALTTTSFFKAGASFSGVMDLQLLANETHKFESRYLDHLIGSPDDFPERYITRSPLHQHDKLDAPVIFFQGINDPIVPPNQAEKIYAVVKEKGIPTAYLLFEDESHNFQKSENLRYSLEAEIFFFSIIFDIDLPDITSNITIDNLNTWREQKNQMAILPETAEVEATTTVPNNETEAHIPDIDKVGMDTVLPDIKETETPSH
ncbi:uncharacterized protein LOC143034070 [Oratosquilla oratoria]|uniref:uncharacterized protein LOC143034070 n=1 Tax=Oratosquilla oratoria TaxID=337810 RepID=UPI003F759C02